MLLGNCRTSGHPPPSSLTSLSSIDSSLPRLCDGVRAYVRAERRLLFFKHASVRACRLRSQVFVPYAFCRPVRDCVGGLPLAVACVVLRALSTPSPPTCLWHARVAQSLTPAFVNRGKSRAWVIGDYSGEERERLTLQYNDREVGGWRGTEGQQEERRKRNK